MADPFETRIEAMFAQPPALADGAAFARSVDRALRRRLLARRVALAVAGAAGLAVALSRLDGLRGMELAAEGLVASGLQALSAAGPYGLPALWMAAGLVAAAAVVVRNAEV